MIQVKIQEHASCRKKNSESAWFDDRETGSTDWNTYLQNSFSAQTLLKCIGFQVKHYSYIKKTLNTFLKGFSEREECASLPVLFLEVGMTIFAQPAGTRLGPSLMGRVLPGSIRNRVAYGLKKKTRSGFESGSGFIKKIWDPTRNPARIKTRYPEITKIPHIYIYL